MSYFDKFPKIYYDANGDGKYKVMTDILSRVKLTANIKENLLEFDYYNVKDGETPEMIAHKYYDDPELHWTILVANEVIDYYSDWPMSVQKFEQFVKDNERNLYIVQYNRKYLWRQTWVINVLWFFTNIGLYLASRNVQPVDNFWNGI